MKGGDIRKEYNNKFAYDLAVTLATIQFSSEYAELTPDNAAVLVASVQDAYDILSGVITSED